MSGYDKGLSGHRNSREATYRQQQAQRQQFQLDKLNTEIRNKDVDEKNKRRYDEHLARERLAKQTEPQQLGARPRDKAETSKGFQLAPGKSEVLSKEQRLKELEEKEQRLDAELKEKQQRLDAELKEKQQRLDAEYKAKKAAIQEEKEKLLKKENLHPNSSHQNELTNIESNAIKPLENLLEKATTSMIETQRPLLFSEIVFSDVNGKQFGISCTNSLTNSTNTLTNSLQFQTQQNMNGIFNPGFSAPAPNMFGPIGSQLSTISNSSSPTSTNSGDPHMESIMWLGAVGTSLTSNCSPVNDFATSLQFNSGNGDGAGCVGIGLGGGESSFFSNSNSNICGSCDRLTPENHCYDCSDSLCDRCVVLHMRSFSNKNHSVQKISTISPPNAMCRMPRFPSPPRVDVDNQCDIHYELLRFVCESCKIIICQECSLRDHRDHQCTCVERYVENPLKTIQDLIDVASAAKNQIKKSIDRVMRFSHYLDRDVHDMVQRHRKSGGIRTANGTINGVFNNGTVRCDDKDHLLVDILEKFRLQKVAIYMDQSSSLRAALAGIATVTDDLKKMRKTLHEYTAFDLAKALIDADNKIDHFMKQTNKLNPAPVNVQQFLISLERRNDQQQQQQPHKPLLPDLQHLVQSSTSLLHPDIAALVAGTSQLNLMANNNGTKPARRPIIRSNRTMHPNNNPQILLAPNLSQQPSTSGLSGWATAPTLSMNMPMTNNDLFRMQNNDLFQGFNGFNTSPPQYATNIYNFNDEPAAFGQCIFNLEGSVIAVRRDEPSLSFAYDGSLEGQLSRPWGVCVDKDGNIIIGDRRNNRIQVFYPDGQFKFAFGSKGSLDGELELPAGVTTDRQNRIIVADKDNHRIQIFSSTGRFILKFGCYGRDLGEFQYPWDVATNSNGHILVTDTRNHRIQMFTSMGHFMTKYSFESYYDRHLKSHITPRGICFTPEGDILVTDFENHRIMKMDGNLTMVKLVRGHEGEGEIHEFNRPSGLCCDDKGQVVIADSKNQRVLIYNTEFEFQWMLDLRRTLSELNNEKDRPSDVAILPDGRIVVLFETSPDTKDFPHPLKTFVQIY